jgi:heme exporter protein D
MMIDLGKYAGTVLSAYVVALALILGLLVLSWWQSVRVRRALEAQERRMGKNG